MIPISNQLSPSQNPVPNHRARALGKVFARDVRETQPIHFGEAQTSASLFKRLLEGIRQKLRAFYNWIAQYLKKIWHLPNSKHSAIEWTSTSDHTVLTRFQEKNAPIRNFYKIDNSLYRGAQPGITDDDRLNPEHLKQSLLYLRDQCGVRTILNLRNDTDLRQEFNHHPKDHQTKEKEAIEQLNASAPDEKHLKYVNIPIRSGVAITETQFAPILSVLQHASTAQPVFVHCKAGIDRTGLVTSLYRALNYPNASFKDVYAEMQACGHDANGIWKGYVNNLAYFLRTRPIFKDYYQQHHAQIDPHPGHMGT